MSRLAPAIERLAQLRDDERTFGAFRLVSPLGKGGFAPVWLAKEVHGTTELRTVAIKLFARDGGQTRVAKDGASSTGQGLATKMDRIAEEARALCQVEHPNVVRFYSMFHDAAADIVGLVMEYVHGRPLDQTLRACAAEGRSLPLDEVLALGIAVASALAAVHRVGLVHRDVKPANVVEAGSVYKLIDFGIAAAEPRAAKDAASSSRKRIVLDDLEIEVGTKAEAVSKTLAMKSGSGDSAPSLTGTMGYIDPRCVETMSPATASSDLYALGATLYECVAGQVPAAVAAKAEGASGLKGEVLDGRCGAMAIAKVAPSIPHSLARLIDALVEPRAEKRPRSAEGVAWELERIRREMAGRTRPLPPEDIGPFRGLGRFEETDRDVYFGRTLEIAASLEMIRSRGLLALIGASGSGKSSLARAGVLPAIAEGGLGKWPKAWDTVVTTPGADPRAQLTQALAPFADAVAAKTPEALVLALAERSEARGRGLVVLVDQLEELVTMADEAGRTFAVQLIAQLGAQAMRGLRCVVAARRDLLDPLLAVPELGRILTKGTLLVSPMSDATWEDVLDQALSAYGYALEDDALRAELLAELRGTATAMPLVQFALTQLWERRDRDKKIIPRAALKAIGGIVGALEMHANATLARIAELGPGASALARDVLVALTTARGTRATVKRDELLARFPGAYTARAIAVLEDARLVVQEADGLTLAHDALLSRWGTLAGWIAEAREDRLLAEAIARDASEWEKTKDTDRLWKKRRLAAAVDLLKSERVDVSGEARAFVKAARSAERRGRVTLFGVAAIVAGALLGGAVYVRESEVARDRQLRDREAQEKEREAQQTREKLDDEKRQKVALEEANRRAEEAKALSQKRSEEFKAELADLERRVVAAKGSLEATKRLYEEIRQKRGEPADTATPESSGPRHPVVASPCNCKPGDVACIMNCQ